MILNLDERGQVYDSVVAVVTGEEHDVLLTVDDKGRYLAWSSDIEVEIPAAVAEGLMDEYNRRRLRRRLAALDVGLYGEAP